MSPLPPIDLSPYFITPADLADAPLDWREFFGNPHPVELEIGSGRGLFLVNAGLSQPETNFLGIEYDFKEARRAARRLQKREMRNVRILGADARLAVKRLIRDQSISAVHIYFPDPWWKRRHKKRRIFSPEFMAEAARVLQPGGLLHAWTDVEEYFQVMLDVVSTIPTFVALPPPAPRDPEHDMDYHTSFERKKRKLGLPIFRARWERVQ